LQVKVVSEYLGKKQKIVRTDSKIQYTYTYASRDDVVYLSVVFLPEFQVFLPSVVQV
jgi:hypothetical protein